MKRTDALISIFATFILSTTILSLATNHWNVNYDASASNRTGLFQQCSNALCCNRRELDRSVTILSLCSVALLSVGTLSSFLFVSTVTNYRNRCYMLVPLTLFSAGITMTLALIQILDRMTLNGYSALAFAIDTVLSYILGGVSLLHASFFYF